MSQYRALLVARVVSAVYLLELLLNLLRPRFRDNEPALTLFDHVEGDSQINQLLGLPEWVFWIVLAGLVIGVLLQIVAARYPADSPTGRRLLWATLAALLAPYGLIPLDIVALYPMTALACVPVGLAGLWALHRIQLYTRLPWVALPAAFAWGALVVWGFSRACGNLTAGFVQGFQDGVATDFNQLIADQYRILDVVLIQLSVLSQLAGAAGVILLLLMFRHRVTDVVTGLVLGAAVGLGYNFTESVIFIRIYGSLGQLNGTTGGFEFWIRQCVTVLGGPVAFGAIAGAALGLAAQTRATGTRRRIVLAGLVAAIGASLASEILPAWFSHRAAAHLERGSLADTVFWSPLWLLIVQVPFIVLTGLLLRSGLQQRARTARAGLTAEAAEESTAITAVDVPVLSSLSLRYWVVVQTGRRLGLPAALALRRLHAAQLDLAVWRGQVDAQPSDGTSELERSTTDREGMDAVRAEIVRMKAVPLPSARTAVAS